MEVTPGQLRTFLAVASTGSVHQAAEELFVSQPAVSASLAALRADIGMALVEREGRGLKLTPAGEILVGYARQVLGLMEEARNAARGQEDPARGRLRLAAVTTAGEELLPQWLGSFRSAYPDVEITLEVGNREHLWAMLADRQVDVGVGGRPPAGGQRLTTLARRPHELVVIAPPDRAHSGRWRAPESGPDASIGQGLAPGQIADVAEADLARATWLVREPGSGTRATTEELLAEMGIDPPLLTIGSNGAIRRAVAIGLGVALLSRDAVFRDLAEGSVVEWRFGPLPLRRFWHFGVRARETLPGAAQLFVDHVLATDEMATGH